MITLDGDNIIVTSEIIYSKTALEEELASLQDAILTDYPEGASDEVKSVIDMYNESKVATNIMNENRRNEINAILSLI